MDLYTAAEEAYKNGYAKGYADGVAFRKELEKKEKAFKESNSWKEKLKRFINGDK